MYTSPSYIIDYICSMSARAASARHKHIISERDTHFAPMQAPVIVDGPVDAECDASEPPEGANDGGDADAEGDPFCLFREAAGSEDEVVNLMGEHEDGEVERREL